MYTEFSWGKPEGPKPLAISRYNLEDNIKWIFNIWDKGSMEYSDLARNRDTWQARVNAGIKRRVT